MPRWECSKCLVSADSKCVDDRSIHLDRCDREGSAIEDLLLRRTIELKWVPKHKDYDTATIEIDLFHRGRRGREVEELIEMLELLLKHKHHITESLCSHDFYLVDEKTCDYDHDDHPVKEEKHDEGQGLKKFKAEEVVIESSTESQE